VAYCLESWFRAGLCTFFTIDCVEKLMRLFVKFLLHLIEFLTSFSTANWLPEVAMEFSSLVLDCGKKYCG